MAELVSVVVPIYNVEKYLDRCLLTITNQTYTNLEIILVDDGSTDSCYDLCEKWADNDKRIKVIHKSNAGLGMARNTGIENATGQYICFFDSDDFIDETTIEKVLDLAKKDNADVVLFGMSVVKRDGSIENVFVPESEKEYYYGEEIINCFLPGIMRSDGSISKINNIRFSAWSCLFSMELVKGSNWKFVSEREIISEDVYSLLGLYRYINKAAILKEALYYYCENDTSLTRSYNDERFERSKHCYLKCVELCEDLGYPNAVKDNCMSSFLGNTMSALKQAVEFAPSKQQSLKYIRKMADDIQLQEILKLKLKENISFKIKTLFWLMVHKHYLFCYLLVRVNSAIGKNRY